MIVIKYTDGTYSALRSDLKPGQIFVLDHHPHWGPLVVVNRVREVGVFGTGEFCIGDQAPAWLCRVIS